MADARLADAMARAGQLRHRRDAARTSSSSASAGRRPRRREQEPSERPSRHRLLGARRLSHRARRGRRECRQCADARLCAPPRRARGRRSVGGSRRPRPIATQIMFNGVTAAGVARAWDDFKAAEARFAASAAGRAAVREQWLTSVETALDDGAAGVGSSITAFFNAARRARRRPGRPARPRAVLTALDDVAGAFRTSAERARAPRPTAIGEAGRARGRRRSTTRSPRSTSQRRDRAAAAGRQRRAPRSRTSATG